jgi:hypothetical protein
MRRRETAQPDRTVLDRLQGSKFIVNFENLFRTMEAEMHRHFNGLSPGGSADYERELQEIVDFWNELSCCAEPGETTWGVLEELQG